MMVAFSSLNNNSVQPSPGLAISLWSSLYPMPRHGLPISRGTLYFMHSYLKLELNQIQLQQRSPQILGIIGVCAGITWPSHILNNQPKLISTGRETAGYQSAMAAIHMHEAHNPDSLAESGTAVRGTSVRDVLTVFSPQRSCKAQSVFSQVSGLWQQRKLLRLSPCHQCSLRF